MFTAASSTGRESWLALAKHPTQAPPRELFCGDATVCQTISSGETQHKHMLFFEKLSSTVLLWRGQPALTKGWLHHHKVSSDLLIMFNEYGKPVESCESVVKSWKYTALNY